MANVFQVILLGMNLYFDLVERRAGEAAAAGRAAGEGGAKMGKGSGESAASAGGAFLRVLGQVLALHARGVVWIGALPSCVLRSS